MSSKSMPKHIRGVHNGTYKDCEECGKIMNSRSMPRHIRDVHNGMIMKKEENKKLADQLSSFLIDESINSLSKIDAL